LIFIKNIKNKNNKIKENRGVKL
jgi:hypothetical protein